MPDLLKDIEALKAQGASDDEIEEFIKANGGVDQSRSAVGNTVRGLAEGAIGGFGSLIEAGGKAVDFFGNLMEGVPSPGARPVGRKPTPQRTLTQSITNTPTAPPKRSGLQEFGQRSQEATHELFDAQGKAGKTGKVIGRIGQEVATAAVGGTAGLKALQGTKLGASLLAGSRGKQIAALTAANAPIDILQGLQYDEGMVLPGRAGSVAENVLFSAAGSAIATRPRKNKLTAPGVEGVPEPSLGPRKALPSGQYNQGPVPERLRLPMTEGERMGRAIEEAVAATKKSSLVASPEDVAQYRRNRDVNADARAWTVGMSDAAQEMAGRTPVSPEPFVPPKKKGMKNRRGAVDLSGGGTGPRLRNRGGGPLMSALHNVSESGLDRIFNRTKGKLAMPSIAVVPEDIPFTNPSFGNTTLIGKDHLFDPKQTPIYDADVYSPRVPDPTGEEQFVRPSEGDLENFVSRSRGDYAALYGRDAAEGQVAEIRRALQNGQMPYARDLLTKLVGPHLRVRTTVKNPDDAAVDLANDLLGRTFRQGVEVGGEVLPYTPENLVKSMLQGGDIRGREFGDDWMESMNLGTARAKAARTFDDLEEMRSHASKNVKPMDKVRKYEAETSDKLNDWLATLGAKAQRYDPDMPIGPPEGGGFSVDGAWLATGEADAFKRVWTRFAQLDPKALTARNLGDMMEEQRLLDPLWETMTETQVEQMLEEGAKIAKRFRKGPVDYFEAKPPRVVELNEFAGAVVAPGTSRKIIEGLKDHGLEVSSWGRGGVIDDPEYWSTVAKNTPLSGLERAHRAAEVARFRRDLSARGLRTLGAAESELLEGVAGGTAGALAGATEGETPQERMLNAALGGVAGAAGARGIGAAARAPRGSRLRAANEAVGGFMPGLSTRTTTPYEDAVVAGRAGTRKPNKGATGDLLHPSNQKIDPDGRRLWELEEEKLIKAGVEKRRVTDAEVAAFAKSVDVDGLRAADVAKLDTAELMALGNRITEDRATYGRMMDELERAAPERRKVLEAEMDGVLNRLMSYDTRLNLASSEQGRGLRILSKLAASKDSYTAAAHAARRVLGVPVLSPEVQEKLAKVMRDPKHRTKKGREVALAKTIQELQKQPWWRVMLDVRRWGLLTAPATWTVNLAGNLAESVGRNAVVTPVAAGLDMAWGALRGTGRTVSTRGRGSWGSGFAHGVKTIDRRMFQGIDPENPLDQLNRQRVDYVASLGLDEARGQEAWRQTLRGGARLLQRSGDAIYGLLGATDRPFYQAALKASLMERSGLRAAREGLAAGSQPWQARVAELMKPENVSVADATMAVVEAMDDTFKTPTLVGRAVKTLGPGAEWVVPFANTPTNLIRKALESTPGLGFLFHEPRLKGMKQKLVDLGVSSEEVAREMRRARTTNFAKQLSTGVGTIWAGYMLTNAGVLSGEYTPPIGRSEAERDEAARQKLLGQGPLTLRIGNTSHSLSALAQYAPLLALGHALAMEGKAEAEEGEGMLGKAGRVAGRAVTTAGRTIAEFPLLQGFENANKLLKGEKAGGIGAYLGRELATLVPYSSGLAATARAMDPVGRRAPETFAEQFKERLPGLREQVAPRVGPLGEITPAVNPLLGALSPTRPANINSGPLYSALEQIGYAPGSARRDGSETAHQYAERRIPEGRRERELLEAMLRMDPAAWRFVSPQARRDFRSTGDWEALLRSALARQRSIVSDQRKAQLTQVAGSGR